MSDATSHPDAAPPRAAAFELGFADVRAGPGDHIGHFYQDDEERLELLVPFLRTGLEADARCVHLRDPARDDGLLEDRLREAGVAVEEAVEEGRLTFLPGASSPGELRELLDDALAHLDGPFGHLRWAGDMTWAMERLDDSRALMRWESTCNLVGDEASPPVVFFCQYSLKEFPGTVVIDALRTHPTCIVGRSVQHNSLYVEPEEFLDELERR